jgi:hypothetical protein
MLSNSGSCILFDRLVPWKDPSGKRTVVFIVCGGFKISLDDGKDGNEKVDYWEVLFGNGKRVKVNKWGRIR